MKTLTISFFCIVLLSLVGCNRKVGVKDNQPAFSDKQFIVTLQDGYNMKDLRSTLGSKVSKMVPSSKSQNVYLLSLTEVMTRDELLAFPFVIEAIRPNDELDEPTQSQSVQKGTSAPIKN